MNPTLFSNTNNLYITFLASVLIWIMFFIAFVYSVFSKNTTIKHFLLVIASTMTALFITQILKLFFPTIRPFQFAGTYPMTITIPWDTGFPSSHSAVAFAVAETFRPDTRYMKFVFYFMAVLVALGRILSHVHYFVDVFFGSLLGVVSVYSIKRLYSYARTKTSA